MSFYWRIGITFVAFVVVFLIAQGLILSRMPRAAPYDVFRAPVLAAEAAAGVSDALVRGQAADLDALLKSKYPFADDGQVGWAVFVVLRDGTMLSNTAGPIPRSVRLTALSALGQRRLEPGDAVQTIPSAPVLVDDRLAGVVLVLVRPPRGSNMPRLVGML